MGQCRIRVLVRRRGCKEKEVAIVIIESAVACCGEEATVLVDGERRALAPG